ncbi:bifunctional adenosylcobinamide kinase/adenosylcobinamide-phosphate guanylyltransferase [Bacteroidota bacterium]
MTEITFITGGTRSGKSSFAQKLAEANSPKPVYLATARIWDEDFKERIKHHKSDRGNNWETIEEEKNIDKLNLKNKTIVLDCITLWLTNIFHDNKYDVEKSLTEAKKIWNNFIRQDFALFVVSNEIGMSVHPENEIARKFTDLQGWMNQYIASSSTHVYLMISGIQTKIK